MVDYYWQGGKVNKCPHCRQEGFQGTHNGCEKCGRVKDTSNGRKRVRQPVDMEFTEEQ